MKRVGFILLSFYLFLMTCAPSMHAFEITSDPQYVVMNFATINELNWAAPEDEWQEKIKPQVLSQIHEMRRALEPLTQADPSKRQLAWSTLMEYMNFPMDTPSASSVYAIKMKRILQISDEENLPVFVPLNGFQWWDQLPELYNWWDNDGTHTDPRFFARQKNPEEFKQRFIKGYNPDNKWNVQWQDWSTPMKLNYRNWGGGGFRLAPPPSLSNKYGTGVTYRSVQRDRLRAILSEMLPFLQKWQLEGRFDMFAGLSLGTEVSLNASILPRDEFQPYGYRDVQDILCPQDQPICGKTTPFGPTQIDTARRQSVNAYLVDLSRLVSSYGVPKQRTYTHVWSEAKPGEPRYTNYADSATTLYARPGLSFYGSAEEPLSLSDWKNTLQLNGNAKWGAIEYSAGTSLSAWQRGIHNTFENSANQAKIMVIYNWQEQKNSGSVQAIRTFLRNAPVQESCDIPEIILNDNFVSTNPTSLSWKYVGNVPSDASLTLFIKQGIKTQNSAPNSMTTKLDPHITSIASPPLPHGLYSWYIEMSGCTNKRNDSTPHVLSILPTYSQNIPRWVEWILDHVPSRFISFVNVRAKLPIRLWR